MKKNQQHMLDISCCSVSPHSLAACAALPLNAVASLWLNNQTVFHYLTHLGPPRSFSTLHTESRQISHFRSVISESSEGGIRSVHAHARQEPGKWKISS